MDGLIIGRIVHYRPRLFDGGPTTPQPCQAAIVVQVWPNEFQIAPDSPERAPGVNLVVLRDGSNDNYHDGKGDMLTSWETSIGEGQGANQFHDPRACESA